jgi:ABC-type uncharacterized transport system involved in gliding motility auxiliary subunit
MRLNLRRCPQRKFGGSVLNETQFGEVTPKFSSQIRDKTVYGKGRAYPKAIQPSPAVWGGISNDPIASQHLIRDEVSRSLVRDKASL